MEEQTTKQQTENKPKRYIDMEEEEINKCIRDYTEMKNNFNNEWDLKHIEASQKQIKKYTEYIQEEKLKYENAIKSFKEEIKKEKKEIKDRNKRIKQTEDIKKSVEIQISNMEYIRDNKEELKKHLTEDKI